MKKTILPVIALTLFFTSCQKNAFRLPEEQAAGIPAGYTNCGVSVETPILAGQTTNTGSVTVWNDANNLYVYYLATGNYLFKKTHLYVGSCNSIPVNNTGSPRIGHFPYNDDHGTGVASFIKVIPLSSFPAGCLCVAAHAEVIAYDPLGAIVFSETGWGQGSQITPGGSWAMKFDYCLQPCLPSGPGGTR